jgi:HEAT repeat protein
MTEDPRRLAESQDVESRRKAALALAEIPPGEAMPLLDRLLGDPNWRVRKAAVESTLGMPPDVALPVLLEALHDPANAGKRNSALETLSKIGAPALPHVYDHLVDGDLDVKLALITLLGEVPNRSSAPHLIFYLSHEDKNIASGAITSLGRLKDTGNLPILMDIFRREDDWLWFHLIDALSNIGGPQASSKLMELYENARFRKAVLKAFGQMADPRVIPFLLEKAGQSGTPVLDLMETVGRIYHAPMPAALLPRHQAEMARLTRNHFPMALLDEMEHAWPQAKVWERRGLILTAGFLADLSLLEFILQELDNPYLQKDAFEAAAAFGHSAAPFVVRRLNQTPAMEQRMLLIRLLAAVGGPEAVVPLLNQAREDDVQIRLEALTALGEMDDPRCLQELLATLREPDPTFHETALRAIRSLVRKYPAHRQKLGAAAQAMVGDDSEEVRRSGYALLAESLGNETDPLLPGLRDESPAVRRTAVRLVADKMGLDAFDLLLQHLADPSPVVRRAVISALGREILTRQPETLMASLSDPDVWVRAETAGFLAQSTAPAVGEALLKLLSEDVLPVRLGALRGLAEVGCGVLFPQVLGIASDEANPIEVRRAALMALARSGRPDAVRALEKALQDPRWEVRSAVLELMGNSQDRRYFPILLKELERDPDPTVKQTVIQALVHLRAAEAVPRMLNYLTDPDLKDAAFAFFTSLGREHIRLIEHEAQSVDFQTKLILIEVLKHLESA